MIIVDLENNDIIMDNFEIIKNEEKEETIIRSDWNKGSSISCRDKEDLIKELISIIKED